MAQTTDELGVWEGLGTYVPLISEWLDIDAFLVQDKITFRLNFEGEPEKARYVLLIRGKFSIAEPAPVSRTFKIHPKIEPHLVDIPVPYNIDPGAFQFRDLQIKKGDKWRRYPNYGTVRDSSWSVRIEQLIR